MLPSTRPLSTVVVAPPMFGRVAPPPPTPPPPPPKDYSGPTRTRRKPEVPSKMYGTTDSDERGPLQAMYEDALNDVWNRFSTCFVLWWEAGGAALATLGVVYLMAWLVSLGNIPRSETPPFDFRLWPFMVAVFAALLVCLLYCMRRMLKRQDDVNKRRAALQAQWDTDAESPTAFQDDPERPPAAMPRHRETA